MYEDGRGVPRDNAQALAWYRKAADQSNATAQSNLGRCYETGHGVPQDASQAMDWYRKAAAQGDSWAKDRLKFLIDAAGFPERGRTEK